MRLAGVGLLACLREEHGPRRGRFLVRSGFALSDPLRERLRQVLHDELTVQNEVQFETAPKLIAGIEVAFDGQKLAWTFDDFLHSLELSVRNLVEEETKAHANPA